MATLRQAHALFLSTIISATPTGVRVTAPLAMQHGKSEVAALAGVGVLGVGAFAVIKGIKGFFTVAAKVGVSSVGKVGAGTLGNAAFGTVGKVGAGTLGKVGAGTLGKVGAGTLGKTAVGAAGARGGVKAYAELEAATLLRDTALVALKRNSSLLSRNQFPHLYRKYPEFAGAIKNSARLDELVRLNPTLSDDVALAIYQKDPALFATGFQKTNLLRHFPGAFDDVIQANVNSQVSREAESIIRGSMRRLEQDGIALSTLSSMEAANLEKKLAESLVKEMQGLAKETSYEWGYNSGKLFVKGDIGHFSFGQELAISDIAKIATAGVIAVGGYKYGWQNRKFERIHTCVGSFCLEIKKNPTPAANVANPALKQLKVTANSAAGPSAGPQSKHYAQRLL